MLGHLGIRVLDLESATNFYDDLLSTLSYTTKKYSELVLFGPSDNSTPIPCFMLRKYAPNAANANSVKPSPVHISFYAKTRKEVDEFHAAGIKAGGNDNGGPGLRTFMPNYYAAFVLDLDGNNVEARDAPCNETNLYFAKNILQEDQIQFLTTINNEAKVRRSTRSLVLANAKGDGKVMSDEDLVAARAKRAEEESAQEAKGKRRWGRKPKSSPPEAEEGTADTAKRGQKCKRGLQEAEEGTADTARRSRKRKSAAQDPAEPSNTVARAPAIASAVQTSGTPIAEDEIVPAPWRAPVAQMF